MTARSHMNGWRIAENGKRKTRRERGLPKLRGFTRGVQGNKAMLRDIPKQHQYHMHRQVLTIHRRLVRDLYAQLNRIKTGRYCWAPPRVRAALEAQLKETSDARNGAV